MFTRKKLVIIVMVCVLLFLSSCGKSAINTWQEQYDLGVRYLSEGNYEEAIIAFTAAIEIEPKRAEAYVGRGNAYIGLGETEENLALAQTDYEQAIELDETNAEAYLGLADVYIRQGDYDKALEILQQGLEKTGNNEDIAAKLAEIEQGEIKDSAGNVRRKNAYDANGNLLWYHIYTYNENGKYDTMTSYDGAGNQTAHIDIEYDSDGKALIGWGYKNKDGVLEKSFFEYDSAGNKVKSTHENGKYEIYEYDDNGRNTKVIWHDVNGKVYGGNTYEYDSTGKMIRQNQYADDWELNYYNIFEYNSLGKRSKYYVYNSSGELSSYTTYNYDEKGNLIEENKYNADGSLRQSIKQ